MTAGRGGEGTQTDLLGDDWRSQDRIDDPRTPKDPDDYCCGLGDNVIAHERTQVSSGLVYMVNRFYEPETGRFTQADPMEFGPEVTWGSANRWTYCFNDPVNISDPLGLFPPILVAVLLGALVGGVIGSISGGWRGFVSGAVGGAVTGGLGFLGYAVLGAAIGSGLTSLINGDPFMDIVLSALLGGALARVGLPFLEDIDDELYHLNSCVLSLDAELWANNIVDFRGSF